MNLRIERYNAGRLGEFIESPGFREMPHIPVSYHRGVSWLHNPRMDPSDCLMYTAHDGDKMIAYRCILPDRLGNLRFGWLSGNWVLPERRRLGIASRLLEEAMRDWDGLLIYTNYSPESRSVYEKSGYFRQYAESTGLRYYCRLASAGLLGRRNAFFRAIRPVLRISDVLVNAWQDRRIRSALKKMKPGLQGAEPIPSVDQETYEFLASHDRLGFCRRDREMFDWINAYPWIVTGSRNDNRYFFSSHASRFCNDCLKISDAGGKPAAFMMLVIRDDTMTVPYACFTPEGSAHAMEILEHYMASLGISYLTTYNRELLSLMDHSGLPLLGRRKMARKYFATRELLGRLPPVPGVFFQDGDGDAVFT